MVALCRALVACFTLLICSPLLAVEIQAQLDAQKVSMGDTVELTVTINEQVFGSEPDFSVLKQDFDVISKRQSSQYNMIGGRISSSTSWVLTLLPKRKGYLAIPPITYDDARSKPIKLHVEKRQNVNPQNTNQLLFLDASIDKKEAYVQEQLVYTVRVFWSSIELYDSSYSPPKVADAVMEQLGDRRKYRTNINGKSYQVTEFRYAIFPQKSGELEIPSAELLATVFSTSRRGFGHDPFNGKQVRRISPDLKINVKPKPAEYPADKPWLPTRSLQLHENWAPDSKEIKIGEPITRSIILEAEGLVDTVLPPIPIPSMDGIKVYPEEANTTSSVGANGMVSKRIESQAIIATQQGTVTIPQIDITWWDVNQEKVRITTVPARTVNVVGSIPKLQTDAVASTPAPLSGSADVAPQSLQATNINTTWQWIALGSMGLWLITIIGLIWFYFSSRSNKSVIESTAPSYSNSQLKAAKKALKSACTRNEPKQAREALIELFKQHWQDDSIKNLDHIARRANHDALASAFNNLEACLYKQSDSQQWESGFLINAVEEVLSKNQKKTKDKELAPLYPT